MSRNPSTPFFSYPGGISVERVRLFRMYNFMNKSVSTWVLDVRQRWSMEEIELLDSGRKFQYSRLCLSDNLVLLLQYEAPPGELAESSLQSALCFH